MKKYSVQTVEETNKLEKKFTVISTFSGGGGSCLGYKMAGGDILAANEFVPEAQKTYSLNFPEVVLLDGDVRGLKGEDFLKAANLKVGELDIFDGSPPCSGFSTAGKRDKDWGEEKEYSSTKQVVDDLFFEYIRLLKEIQPKTFIAENVKGLTLGTARGYLKEIFNRMNDAGYNVKCKVLNAINYGVPQNRERLIFIGVRKDIDIEPSFPEPDHELFFVGQAIEGASVELFRPINPDTETFKIYNKCKNKIKRAQFSKYNPKGTGFTRYRLSHHDYSCTINTREEIFHPDEPRTMSIGELKRLQSLPDDYQLTGSFGMQWERIARMVPPVMMKAIAENLYEKVIKNV